MYAFGSADSPLAPSLAVSGYQAHQRADIYHSGLWLAGSQVAWETKKHVDLAVSTGELEPGLHPSKWSKWLVGDLAEAQARYRDPSANWLPKLSVLGYLNSWRNLTPAQLAAFSGYRNLGSFSSKVIQDAFLASLIDIGALASWVPTRKSSRQVILRVNKAHRFDRTIDPYLTYPERVFVTGADGFTAERQYDRHNLLAAEVSLRVAEFGLMPMVLGETQSKASLLFPHKKDISGRSGDGVWMRADGLKVVLELTATSHEHQVKTKINGWAKDMSKSLLEDDGVVVLFLVAPNLENQERMPAIMSEVKANIVKFGREHHGVRGEHILDRVMVAAWDSWFPARHQYSDAFARLEVQRYDKDLKEWYTGSICDFGFSPAERDEMSSVLPNLALIASAPRFNRLAVAQNGLPDLHAITAEKLGYELPIPATRDFDAGEPRGNLANRKEGSRPLRLMPGLLQTKVAPTVNGERDLTETLF